MKSKKAKFTFCLCGVLLSSLLQTYVIKTFMHSANLLSSGFTGVAILINKIISLYGLEMSTSLCMLLLNIPVALVCYKKISKKFTILSTVQFVTTSLFLKVLEFSILFEDVILNVAFGGFLYGISIVLALKSHGSTGGTDFIALYVSNKINRSIWEHVFIFNAIILCVFGYFFGWIYAGYSILFQFISTKTISTFHHRYKRVTLQITTTDPDNVINTYVQHFKHGLSCIQGYGGYSGKKQYLLHTVISSYELNDAVNIIKEKDQNAIINVFRTEQFFGNFYQQPYD